jgi:hypothetical protein
VLAVAFHLDESPAERAMQRAALRDLL